MERHADQIWQSVLSQGMSVADRKKHRIIDATIQLIAEDGIEAVTFENIGQILKTTKANIKYHFGNKDDLIFTAARLVVANAQAMTAAAVERVSTPEDKLMAIIEAAFDWYQRFPKHVRVWALFIYYSHIRADYAKFFHEVRTVGQSRMQLLLRALPREEGKIPSYEKAAADIQNTLYGKVIALAGDQRGVRASKQESIEIISVLLKAKGIRW